MEQQRKTSTQTGERNTNLDTSHRVS